MIPAVWKGAKYRQLKLLRKWCPVIPEEGADVFTCYTSISLKAQPPWSINHEAQSVWKAPTWRSSKPVKRWWGPITWKRRQPRNPSSSSPDVNSFSFQVEQHSQDGLFKSYIGGGGRNERPIHIRRSTSTSTHFENIKPPSGTFAKHIMTI